MNRLAWVLAGLFVVLVVVLIFWFGDESGETTTTLGASTSTLPGATTTEGEPATTGPATSTTPSETTTTTLATTTTFGLEGNWAGDPVVVASFGALGWWTVDGWIQVDQDTSLPLVGNESYQVAVLGQEAITTGGAPTTLCEPLENPGVVLEDADLLGGFPGPVGLGISAAWKLVPHLVEEIEDDGTYAAFAGELLAERGLNVPDPVIKQLLRVDLEGDGVNEVIVVAEDVPPDLLGEPGDYSIAFVRKTVAGDIRTTILGESLYVSEDEPPLLFSFSVGAVADLNGDGKMEIALSSFYYEGVAVEVWEHVSDEQGLVPQIGQGCGV